MKNVVPFQLRRYTILAVLFAFGSPAKKAWAHHTTDEATPPPHLHENWFEHDQNLTRAHLNEESHVAIYFDPDVDEKNITCLYNYTSKAWAYMTSTYGAFGPDPYLYLVIHQGKYNGSHQGYSLSKDSIHGNRNLFDLDLNFHHQNNPSGDHKQMEMDLLTAKLALFVEYSSNNRSDSPSRDVWGETLDTPWTDIFTFDLYTNLNFTAEAQRFKATKLTEVHNIPRNHTFWFRDWFLPIYTDHGGNGALRQYFQLLSQNVDERDGEYKYYLRMGDFIHFWSGAVKSNLKERAALAFGWNSYIENQWLEARIRFPEVAKMYKCNNCTTTVLSRRKELLYPTETKITTSATTYHNIKRECQPSTVVTTALCTSVTANVLLTSLFIVVIIYFRLRVQKLEKEVGGLNNQVMKDYFEGDRSAHDAVIQNETEIHINDKQALV